MKKGRKTFKITAASAAVIIFLVLSRLWDSVGLSVMGEIGDRLNRWEGKSLNSGFKTRIKSGNLSTDYEIEQALKDVESLDLNTVNLPIAVNIENLGSSTMSLDMGSVKKAKKLVKKLRSSEKSRKLNIILEPYPWISRGEHYETQWRPEDMEAFFYNWENSVIRPIIKEAAIPLRVDALCIASNLVHMETYEDRWDSIIAAAREDYRGLLTYKTNWWYTAVWDEETKEAYNKKLQNPLFSKVDYISVAAYFELSDKPVNTVQELKDSLYSAAIHKREQNIVKELEKFHEKWGKPVFFGELGFPRRNNAATHPWHPSPSETVNGEEQARCFQAYKEVFTQDWFLGFSIFAIGEKSEDKNYYPSAESAEVIRGWFKE